MPFLQRFREAVRIAGVAALAAFAASAAAAQTSGAQTEVVVTTSTITITEGLLSAEESSEAVQFFVETLLPAAPGFEAAIPALEDAGYTLNADDAWVDPTGRIMVGFPPDSVWMSWPTDAPSDEADQAAAAMAEILGLAPSRTEPAGQPPQWSVTVNGAPLVVMVTPAEAGAVTQIGFMALGFSLSGVTFPTE